MPSANEVKKLQQAYDAAVQGVANAEPGSVAYTPAMEAKAKAYTLLLRAKGAERKLNDPRHEASRRTGRNTAHV